MKTKVVALIMGNHPDRGDPTTCGEAHVLRKADCPDDTTARTWLDSKLNEPMPDGILSRYGMLIRKELDESYGWDSVAESDTITAEDNGKPTKWFTN
jgi:hypothetical protein